MKKTSADETDVLIIGAGPSGALAGARLVQSGHRVTVLEKDHFPRFSIGESLLPQCMAFIEQAGMLEAVETAGFQLKDGAAFSWGGRYTDFDFSDKFSPGWGTTFQVERARFDKVLADAAERAGVEICYGQEITHVAFDECGGLLHARNGNGDHLEYRAKFVLDASGFGRVLPRLLRLDRPSAFPSRRSLFTHVEDCIDAVEFDRQKILITVHPQNPDIWYWLIPFSNGRSSVGVVGDASFFADFNGAPDEILRELINCDSRLQQWLSQAVFDSRTGDITGYAADVSRLWGPHYALLGNAGEFLDPVFSSGVTIAMKSATLAAAVLDCQLRGEPVDWESDYAEPLRLGVDTFRTFVEMWYEGKLQDIFFQEQASSHIRAQICSILAGYAWDVQNPFVRDTRRRLEVLAELCGGSA